MATIDITGYGYGGGLTGQRIPQGTIDIRPGVKALERVCIQFLRRGTLTVMRAMARTIKTDTTFARGALGTDIDKENLKGYAGILYSQNPGVDPVRLQYPAWQNEGIPSGKGSKPAGVPFRVSFFNPNGTLREQLVKWAERHGFQVWRTMTGKTTSRRRKGSVRLGELGMGMAMRSIRVWGYRHPWADVALVNAEPAVADELQALRGKLGEV